MLSRILFLSLVLVLSSITAQADHVVVSGVGSDTQLCCGVFKFTLQNSDGSISMNFLTLLTVNPIGSSAPGGSPFFLNFNGSGLDVVGTLGANGLTFPALGDIHIVAAGVPAPTECIAGEFHISTPFTFTGGVAGFDSPFFLTANQVISFSLIGNGVLDATVRSIPGGDGQGRPLYTITHITYTLTTPEPATMFLLCTGLAGVAAIIRKRCKSA